MEQKLKKAIEKNTSHHRALFEIAVSEFNTADWEALQKTAGRLKAAEVLNRALTKLLSDPPEPTPDHCTEPTI